MRNPIRHRNSGSVLVLSLLLLLALGALTASLTVLNVRLHGEHARARDDLRAFCVAEAGLNEAFAVLDENGLDSLRALAYPRPIGAGSYRVEVLDGRDDMEIDVDRIRLRSIGESGRDAAGVQLMIWHEPTGPYEFAAFGAQGVLLHSNVMLDSYDSKDGSYPDGVEYVNDFGNVGSFDKITFDSNVSIYGDALVGPDGVFVDDFSGLQITGDVEAKELSEDMPAITVPSYPTQGILLTTGNVTIPSGNHHYSAITVDKGTLTIKGPATVVVDDLLVSSGTKVLVDATDGPVKIYATGDFELRSNSSVTTNTERARDIEVLITSSNLPGGGAIIDLNSNAEFMGTIYAPNAALKLSSNFSVYGAVKAAFVELESNTAIHFDEDLLYDQLVEDIFQRVSWRRLSPAEFQGLAP